MSHYDGIILTSYLIRPRLDSEIVLSMLINPNPNGGKSKKTPTDQKSLAMDNSMAMIKYLNSINISKTCIT